MKQKKMSAKKDKIKYPIGAKLIIIITSLLLLSLGIITGLVSIMISGDVRITAEDNNFTVNKRSASEAETVLGMARSNSLVLLNTLNALGTGNPVASLAVDHFFECNQDIAFIGVARRGGELDFFLTRNLVNERFFYSNELEQDIINDFLDNHEDFIARSCEGETLLANAAPVFGIPVLALFYPWHEAGRPDVGIALFSANTLTENFTEGTNVSYMVNDEGAYLINADFELIRACAISSSPLTDLMMESADTGRQTLYKEADGTRYFGAYRKISIGNAAVMTIIPYDKVFEGIAATTRRNIYLSCAVLFIVIVFIWFFSKSVSVPVKALAAAALEIEGGKFDFNLKPKTQDEIGLLTNSFQRMTGALNIFGRFTNKGIAVKAMRGEIKPGGLPKHATIFFSDIRSFTAKSENFTKAYGEEASNKIIHWLNVYFTKMIECVEVTNGVVDKFIGDAVMAHWGAAYSAGSPAKDAFNCVKAALMMREALYELNKGRTDSDASNPPIQIGCGINSGIVTAGQLGSEQRMEYTVIGDPVNLASRVEALNKPMGTDILISEDTWNLVGDLFITEEMPSVTVKGKEAPVRIFAVVNFKGPAGPQSLAEVREMLGITPPDLSKVDTDAEEKKYKIGSKKKKEKIILTQKVTKRKKKI